MTKENENLKQQTGQVFEEYLFKREVGTKKKVFTILIGLLTLILVMTTMIFAFKKYKERDWTQEELESYAQSIRASSDSLEMYGTKSLYFLNSSDFKWTLAAVKSLPYDPEGKSNTGISLEKVIETYGAPSKVEVIPEGHKVDELEISYIPNPSEKEAIVELTFEKIKGVHRLTEKHAAGPDFSDNPYQEEWGTIFNWTKEDFEKISLTPLENHLRQTNNNQDNLYDKIVAKYGAPNEISYTLDNDLETIFAIYYHIEVDDWKKSDYVTLMISSYGPDKPLVLTGKTGQFNGKLIK